MTGENTAVVIVMAVVGAVLIFFVFFSSYLRGRSMQRLYRARAAAVSNTAPISSPSDPIRGRGLDQAVINSFPTFEYSAVESYITRQKGALECYVCLNEFEPHETLRLLPSCDHAFHVGCINAWLASNATCPVCRAKLHDLTHHITTDEVGPRDHDDVVMINVTEATDDDHDHDADVDPPPPRPRPKLLGRNLTWRSMRSRKPMWSATVGMMRLTRSKSTGRVAVKQWETMERFTLRLPEEVRRKIIAGKLRRPKISHDDRVIIPGRGGSHREESSWGKWVSSLAPGFLYTRSKSMEPPAITPAFDHV